MDKRAPICFNKKKVDVTVEFENIGHVDQLNSKFYAEFFIELKWISVEKIENYDPLIHWNPQLYIENAQSILSEYIHHELQSEQNTHYVIESRKIKGLQTFKWCLCIKQFNK